MFNWLSVEERLLKIASSFLDLESFTFKHLVFTVIKWLVNCPISIPITEE